MRPIYAWHFLNNGRKLANGDNRPIVPGETLKVDPPLMLCQHGLHASIDPIDALKYAVNKAEISRVVLSGEIVRGDDKLVASVRKTLWIMDCDKVLHEFACRCAERALKRAKVKDQRCWGAIETKRAWLAGKTTDAELNAAAYAAYAASAASAASAAAHAAAYAAHAAAHAAAAYAAAYDAARAAAHAAADAAAERKWQNRLLTRMLLKAHRSTQ